MPPQYPPRALPLYETWNSRPISVFTRASVHRWSARPWTSRPRSNSRFSLAIWAELSLGRPGDPFDRTPTSPRSRRLQLWSCAGSDNQKWSKA
ncbi:MULTISPECIES: hypothetical protein [unclassified Streptomyces]|uniref:hypothetical protein n=1 Tax=unclassified Streptomyces TaxID=2593676 RepID=UPI00339FE9B9